nr:hypothetical protein [Serratia plymuthica]
MNYEALKIERDRFQQINEQTLQVKLQMAETIKKLLEENAGMRAVIDAAVAVAADSDGIAGWHLNGDIAGWDEILPGLNIETPTTNAAIEARGVEKLADKRGFSFQHGSIHAHFGNGDVMVGSTTFENGHAGICFAPVREKEGDVGTEYKWTEGKNTDDVGAVFVISSSSVAGLEVIQGKLSEAIEQLREDK